MSARRITRRLACAAGVWLILAWKTGDARGLDPFAFFRSAVTLDLEERARLERGDVVVRIIPARDG